MTGAHVPSRLRRVGGKSQRRALNGTPGWVVWCIEFTYPPTTDRDQAEEQLRLANTNGCPAEHEIRPVLIRSDGINFRYVKEHPCPTTQR